MNRGDRRQAIFEDDRDHHSFLETLAEACQKTCWQVLGTYTSRFNRRHKEFGHLFSGRYKALVVDGSGNGYLKTVCDYVHLNPVEARAERLLARSLKSLRWTEEDLAKRRKGDPGKVRLATTLRAETTMPLAWIAQRLAMGSRGYLTWLLYRAGKN